jgi:penicillin-binding protein 1A
MKKIVVLVALLVAFVGAVGSTAVGFVFYSVYFGDYSQLSKERILEILSKETVVYFDDGQTQLGSLFGEEHRQYVNIDEVPKDLKNAVLAAEDDSFYRHSGVDFVSTLRAAIVNVLFNRREGASTITQQTVKNLYGRPVTNYLAKYTEAINAFKLERSFSKDEILEFYLNQFHVTGNGRGVGVAAKFYFNKEVSELTLVESAFIAGSVKGPDLYTPFTKKSLEARERALRRASDRKNYVLKRMRDLKLIADSQYEQGVATRIPFVQGRFQFNELSVIDLIKGQLNRKEVLETLGAEKVDQIATMGLKVTTTINEEIQDYAQYGVRQNLSRLQTILKGFAPASESDFRNYSQLLLREFYVGRVSSVDKTKGKESVRVGLGLAQCIITTDGVDRMAKFIDHGRYKGLEVAKTSLFSQLAEGTPVLVSVKKEILAAATEGNGSSVDAAPSPQPSAAPSVSPKEAATGPAPIDDVVHTYECDLETRPQVNGGAIAIDKGEIVSVVGGFSPHEYNRAIYARRQPGSTFKTLTYYAALHLGWSALDPLVNIRDAYEWQSQFYYPRPDHPPKTLTTTLVGAGSFSENLASVWLMAHLTKKLSPTQFRELLENLEVVDGKEDDTTLANKMRDKFNVGFGPSELAEGVMESLIEEYAHELEIVADGELYINLMTMNAGGPRYEKEMDRIRRFRDKNFVDKERRARLNMLRNNLNRWNRLREQWSRDAATAKASLEQGNAAALAPILARLKVTKSGRLAYFAESEGFDPSTYSSLLVPVEYATLSTAELTERLKDFINQGEPDLKNDVWLDAYLPAGLVTELAASHAERLAKVAALPLQERMLWNFDLRYSAGMLFAKNLVDEMGVVSKIEWVPSFPLGTNDVSLAELAMSYQTILTGETYQFFQDEALNQLSLVKRIEDSQGNLLWESKRGSRQAFDHFYSSSMLSILRGTVTRGTGRIANSSVLVDGGAESADEKLRAARIRVPVFGKTGTTNDYTNATFVGFLPFPDDSGMTKLNAEHAVTIASYVGYDNNKPMRRGGVKIAGGTGALPAWIEIAKSIIRQRKYSDGIDWNTIVQSGGSEVAFDYEDSERLVVPLHSSVVLSAESSAALSGSGAVDLNAFHDDYEDQADETLVVNLPGRVEKGVFNPRTKVSFPRARGGVIIPRDIPELNIRSGTDLDGSPDLQAGDGSPGDVGQGNDGASSDSMASAGTKGVGAPESESQIPPAPGAGASSGSAPGSQPPGGGPDQGGYEFIIPPPPKTSGDVTSGENAP